MADVTEQIRQQLEDIADRAVAEINCLRNMMNNTAQAAARLEQERDGLLSARDDRRVQLWAALSVAYKHLDLDALRVSHAKDAEEIEAALWDRPSSSAGESL